MASIARANDTLACRGKEWFRGSDIYRQSELDHRSDKQSITIKSQGAQAEVQGATINLQPGEQITGCRDGAARQSAL